MPAPNLKTAQFTVGPNNSVAIFNGGVEVDIGLITQIMWMSKPEIEKKRISLMSGFAFTLPFIQQWTGEFTIQRTDNKLDSVWYNLFELPYRTTGIYPSFNIIQTIRETDGSTSRYTFQGAAIFYDDAGTYENENGVVQKLSFSAPARIIG